LVKDNLYSSSIFNLNFLKKLSYDSHLLQMVIYLSNPKYLCDIIFTLESLLQISVVKRGRSWRYRGAERPKMGCRDTTPPRSALGESGFRGCETVEQGGPIASQSGRVSGSEHKTTVFWFLEIVSGQICRRKMRGGRRRKRKEKEKREGRGKQLYFSFYQSETHSCTKQF